MIAVRGGTRTFVKVCGVTRVEDALAAARAGADAVGFVFAGSPRAVSASRARAIGDALPPGVLRVGVFVNEDAARVAAIAAEARLQLLQLHGEEPPELCRRLPLPVVKAIRVRGGELTLDPAAYRGSVSALLLDTFDPGARGGTGKPFDRDVVGEVAKLGVPVIVSGGLGVDTVGPVVRAHRPYGVDVSSGVEVAPGIKDASLIERFVRAVREAEAAALAAETAVRR